MKFRASFRELTASDINRDCPILQEPDEVDAYFQAMTQEIAALDGVTGVSSHEGMILIITTSELDLASLKSKLKVVLDDFYEYVRISDISPV